MSDNVLSSGAKGGRAAHNQTKDFARVDLTFALELGSLTPWTTATMKSIEIKTKQFLTSTLTTPRSNLRQRELALFRLRPSIWCRQIAAFSRNANAGDATPSASVIFLFPISMRRPVHRVLHAETADAGNGCHALREADEAAILRPTQGATAILRAPGIVLRVRRSAEDH